MDHKYTYTFIIPHHNSPELLNRCLDSIPQREDIQIIVVDDNSLECKRPNVRRPDVEIIYIDAEQTKGAGHARNVGLSKAKGKWLLFADCDDYYSSNFLVILDKYRDSDIDVLYFNYYFKDGETGELYDDNNLQNAIECYDGTQENNEFIRYRNNTPWTKMISRDFIVRIEAYFEEVVNGNDVLFSLWIGAKANIIEVDNARLYNYIKTPNSIGTKKQSITGLICRVTHTIQHNAFNANISHKEWNVSVLNFVLNKVRKMHIFEAFLFVCSLIVAIPSFLSNKNKWVYIIGK